MSFDLRMQKANQSLKNSGYELVFACDETVLCMRRGLQEIDNNLPVLFPICLNNGYYNKDKIELMMRFLPSFADRVVIFFTDGPARNNYLAFGKSESEALIEARLQRNRLYNHCQQSLSKITGISADFDNWEDIYANPEYQNEYEEIRRLYNRSDEFRDEVEQGTRHVLTRIASHHGRAFDEAKMDIAVDYVLQELAYILSAPSRWNVEKLTYIYYDRWPVLEKLLDGKYDGIVKSQVNYVMVTLQS